MCTEKYKFASCLNKLLFTEDKDSPQTNPIKIQRIIEVYMPSPTRYIYTMNCTPKSQETSIKEGNEQFLRVRKPGHFL